MLHLEASLCAHSPVAGLDCQQDVPAKRSKMTNAQTDGVGPAVEIDEDLHSRQVR